MPYDLSYMWNLNNITSKTMKRLKENWWLPEGRGVFEGD